MSESRSIADALTGIAALDGLEIRMGIQGTKASEAKTVRLASGDIIENTTVTNVEVAYALEYGTPTTPEYAPYRSNADEGGRRWLGALANRYIAFADTLDAAALEVGLREIGVAMVSDQKEMILEIDEPPNSQITIDLKGSDEVMVDTGQFINSQRADVRIPGHPSFLVG